MFKGTVETSMINHLRAFYGKL